MIQHGRWIFISNYSKLDSLKDKFQILKDCWTDIYLEVNSYQTLEIYLDADKSGGYNGFLVFGCHNELTERSFAGFIFGTSNSWGWGVKYNKLFGNDNIVKMENGNTESKQLKIINKSGSQFHVQILSLFNDWNKSILSWKII